MTRIFALIVVLVVASCGGQPAPTTQTATPAPTQVAQQTQVPTTAPTVAPRSTPRPTPKLPLLAEVTSDADVEDLFICLPPLEVAKLMEGNTYEDFKLPVPFNPRGLKFQMSAYNYKHSEGDIFWAIAFKFTSGTATIKSYLTTPVVLVFLGDPEAKRYELAPLDLRKPQNNPGLPVTYPFGGPGAYANLSPDAKPMIPTTSGTDIAKDIGKPLFEINAATSPVIGWTWQGQPIGHLVFFGRDRAANSKINASPITSNSLLKRDGKFVCIQ